MLNRWRKSKRCNFGCIDQIKNVRKTWFARWFWERFAVQNKSLKKQVGLYEIENIDNANVLAIAINPKEYFEKYKG